MQHILSTHFDNYVKGPEWHRRFKVLLGDGIFNVDGKLWYLHRKLSSRMFSTGLPILGRCWSEEARPCTADIHTCLI